MLGWNSRDDLLATTVEHQRMAAEVLLCDPLDLTAWCEPPFGDIPGLIVYERPPVSPA